MAAQCLEPAVRWCALVRVLARQVLQGLVWLALLGAAQAAHAQGPGGVEKIADIPYGSDPRERMDVYLPSTRGPQPFPVIFMVHGGAWRLGDKAAASVVDNKVARWVPQGFVLVSVGYPMLPDTPVSQQVHAVALALAAAQRQAGAWGAAADKFILMGHSAGAHLVALINANPAGAQQLGASPWLGAVALDSAMLDVATGMREARGPLRTVYNGAFGNDPAYWQQLSPYQQWVRGAPPLQLVCSELRRDSCPQARAMAEHVHRLGGRAELLPKPLKHSQINAELGLDGAYTRAVEGFMASLDLAVARALQR